MKAIVFHALDPFNEKYSWCEICADDNVDTTISNAHKHCTEITSEEVYFAFDKRK